MENLSNEEIMIKLKEGYEEWIDVIGKKCNAALQCLDYNDINIDEMLICDKCKKTVIRWTNDDGTYKNYDQCKTCNKIICNECSDDYRVFERFICYKCEEFKELIASIK